MLTEGLRNLVSKRLMKTKIKSVITIAVISAITILSSCNNETIVTERENTSSFIQEMDQQTAMSRFAEILSTATYNRPEVREFLKREAIKQFDKNYDILYINVKDMSIGNETFCEILNHYANLGELDCIENAVPTINIFIPQISMLGVRPENMDCKDKEIPVVLPDGINNKLYVDGVIVDSIAKGNVPGFHVFVINKNSRVIVDAQTRSIGKRFRFIDPEYDNSLSKSATRSVYIVSSKIGDKAIEAYSYFNKDDASNQSMALQRDYIYYGMTPSSSKGMLNQSVSEYLCFIEIDPKAYFMITDKSSLDPHTDDPEIKETRVRRFNNNITTEELINEFWTKGCYNIKIEMVSSNSSKPLVKHLALKPDDIWIFNWEETFIPYPSWERKYICTIDPAKFTARRYFLPLKSLSFGKWDLSNESLCRDIAFAEEDPGTIVTDKYDFQTVKVNSTKVNGEVKIGLGLGSKNNTINVGGGADYNSSTTTTVSREITVTRTNKDDDLGIDRVYFYDPIIEGHPNAKYLMKEYNTGIVRFGITAM